MPGIAVDTGTATGGLMMNFKDQDWEAKRLSSLPCHSSLRSESRCPSTQILRFAQNDTARTTKRHFTPHKLSEILSEAKNDTAKASGFPMVMVPLHYRRCVRSIGPYRRSRASANSCPSRKRFSGTFSKHRIITASKSGGMLGSYSLGDASGSCVSCIATSRGE